MKNARTNSHPARTNPARDACTVSHDAPTRRRPDLSRVAPCRVWETCHANPGRLLSGRCVSAGGAFNSETRVKRGPRLVHGDKELLEKLGRNDLCPCGSGRLFKRCCLTSRSFQRSRPLLARVRPDGPRGAGPGATRLRRRSRRRPGGSRRPPPAWAAWPGPWSANGWRVRPGPPGAEATGACFTPDGRALFVSVQHPGENSETLAELTTRWPTMDPAMPPMPAVVVVTRQGGGEIGA